MEKAKGSYPCGGRGPWIAGRIARGVVFGLLFAVVFGIVVRLLWNWLMPAVFGLREITYFQAIGMVILAHILFGHKGPRGLMHRPGPGPWALHGPCSPGHAENSAIRDWHRYDEWWDAEGREAFRNYIDRQKQ